MLDEDVEERDEREGFSVGGVKGRVGSTRIGLSGGVNERLLVILRVRPVRLRDGATVLDTREVLVAGSVEALGRCSGRELEEGSEVVELVDGRRFRTEDSSVYAVFDDSDSAEWDGEGG